MSKSIGSAIYVVVLLMIFASGCASSTTPIPPSSTPSPTFSPIPPTLTPEPTPTPTVKPSPTPLPGSLVYPLDTLGTSIPWLPQDKAKVINSVFFNTQAPPFNNTLVRQAFAASIDRDVIVEMAEKWYAVDPSPATTFIPSQVLGRDLYGEVGINFDPTRAMDLLSQAGYTDTSSFPKVTLIVNYYGDTAPGARFNMAKAMADMWHTYLGITVDVQAMKLQGFVNRIKADPPELFWNGWVDSDPSMINIFRSDSEWNIGQFSNPDFDSLMDRAESSHEPAERQILYIQADRIICETETVVLPLYTTD